MVGITAGGVELLAQRYARAGSFLYTVGVPLARLTDVLPVPDPNVPAEGNRRVSIQHARDFADYWQTNERWAVPPLLADTRHSLQAHFTPIAGSGDLVAGVLRLPHPDESGLHILDGQHRVLGWSLLRDEPGDHHRRLDDEAVTLEILERIDVDDHKQFFYDIAANARGVSKSLSAGFDKRLPLHRAAQRLADEHPLLAGRVDMENDRVGNRRSQLLSLQNVVDVVSAANTGINGWIPQARRATLNDESAYQVATRVLDALCWAFDELTDVCEDAVSPLQLRETTLLGSVSMLRVLAASYHNLAVRNGEVLESGDAHARALFHVLNEHMALPIDDLWWSSEVFARRDAKGPRARRQDLQSLVQYIGYIAARVRPATPRPRPAPPSASPAPPLLATAAPSSAPSAPMPRAPVPLTPVPLTPPVPAAELPSAPGHGTASTDVDAAESDNDEAMPAVLAGPAVPDDLLQLYARDVAMYPLLSAQDERQLATTIEAGVLAEERLNRDRTLQRRTRRELAALADEGRAAFETFVCSNLRLVISIARRYNGHGLSMADLVQEGNIGLIRAVQGFDWRTGNKFSTYATWWIRQTITRGLADTGRTIRLPVHVVERLNKVRAAHHRLTEQMGRRPTVRELAASTGLELDEVAELLGYDHAMWSLDQSFPATDDELADAEWDGERWVMPLGALVADDEQNVEDDALEAVRLERMREQLHQVLDTLREREAGVISMRIGLTDGEERTLEEIGRVYGVTRERIRQIEKATMEKLCHPARSDGLRPYLDR